MKSSSQSRLAIAFLASIVSGYASAQSYPPVFKPGETILFQGDSITDMNRGRTEDPNHILGHSYAFLIGSKYGNTYPNANLTFINRGVSGNTIADMTARWQTDTLDLNPGVLSILIGVNDVYFAITKHETFSPDAEYQAYDKLLDQTLKANPVLKLVLCQPMILDVGMVLKDPENWHKDVSAMDDIVARLGVKYHACVVPLQTVFDDAAKRAPTNHWIWDGIHPTYSGQQLLADAWVKAYNDFFISPLVDPARNSAIAPEVNRERDSYDWLHRHDDVLDQQKKVDPDVVMIGDSITHFWGGEPHANHVNGPNSWTETFKGLNVLNMGFGWDRTQNVLWRINHGELSGVHPKTVVLNIGTNNLVGDPTTRQNDPSETAEGVLAVVGAIRERVPNARIVVMGVFPRGFEKDNALDRSIKDLNSILNNSLRGYPNTTFLDIGSKMREADGSISKGRFFDGTHPTDAGYKIWGDELTRIGVGK